MIATSEKLIAEFDAIAKNTRTTGATASVKSALKKAIDNHDKIVKIVIKDVCEIDSIHIQSIYNALKAFNLDYRKNDILRYERVNGKHNHISMFIVKLA